MTPIMTDKDILEFAQSSENIIDANSDDENEMNTSSCSSSSKMSNIVKTMREKPREIDRYKSNHSTFRRFFTDNIMNHYQYGVTPNNRERDQYDVKDLVNGIIMRSKGHVFKGGSVSCDARKGNLGALFLYFMDAFALDFDFIDDNSIFSSY
ncbi:hypothetical protein TNCV_3272061 [Trichonephila clavipes]|nr:hypothetical protein TNCV_3272061 [Trichonephila clavipes]